MLKLILKIWPSFLPIMIYVIWMVVIKGIILRFLLRKRKIIEGEKLVGEKATEEVEKLGIFSLKNRYFVVVLYVSLLMAIFTLIRLAF